MECSAPDVPVLAISLSLLELMSIESVKPSNHLILCCPLLLCPQSFSASGSNLLPTPVPRGSPISANIPDGTHNDHVTCSDDAMNSKIGGEKYSCSLENPFKAKGHKPSRTQRAQAMLREGKRKNMGEVCSATSTGLLPSYHKSWAPEPPSPRCTSPDVFSPHHVLSSEPTPPMYYQEDPPDLKVLLDPGVFKL